MKPIYDEIIKYSVTNPSRFHMPAHFGKKQSDTVLYDSAQFDITELDFSDNLQNPTGIILESENLAASDYQSKKCFYFTSGSTTAILTALASVRTLSDEIIVQRACHKSVYSALRHLNYTPRFIMPESLGSFPFSVTADAVEKAILDYPDSSAVIITSPDYFGRCANADAIKRITDKYKKLLIVDSAHGAHFPYCDKFPKGFTSIADITVTSFHKTLPVYSGGSALFCNNETLLDKIAMLRADYHTSSPSYLTLASIDYALCEMRTSGQKLYLRLYSEIEKLKSDLSNIAFLPTDDFSRLTMKTGKIGTEKLCSFNLFPEMIYGDYVVLITSPFNIDELLRVYDALSNISISPDTDNYTSLVNPVEGRLTNKEVFVDLDKSVGLTAAREVGVYPPGIPLVARGEVITAEIAEILSRGNTFGFVNNKICVTI